MAASPTPPCRRVQSAHRVLAHGHLAVLVDPVRGRADLVAAGGVASPAALALLVGHAGPEVRVAVPAARRHELLLPPVPAPAVAVVVAVAGEDGSIPGAGAPAGPEAAGLRLVASGGLVPVAVLGTLLGGGEAPADPDEARRFGDRHAFPVLDRDDLSAWRAWGTALDPVA